MRHGLIAVLLLVVSACRPETNAKRPAPLPSAQSVSTLADVLAKADPRIAERLGSQALPWATKDGLTTSLPLPPGFTGLAVKLPASAADALEVNAGGDALVRLAPRGAKASPLELEGHRAIYREVYPATDALLVSGSDWVEQLWVLRGPQAPTRFEFDVSLPGAVRGVRADAGGLEFTDARGDAVLRLRQPWGVDAKGRRVEAKASWTGARVVVAVETADVAWPVLLDPVIELTGWTNMGFAGRFGHAMATLGTKVVLFGGENASARLGDTWEWDGTNWMQRTPLNAPSARSGHAMATLTTMAGTTTVVLFGGHDNASYKNDTWSWDGSNWTVLSPANVPAVRDGHAMASIGFRVMLFGGADAASELGDTWEFDGTNWNQKTPNTSPPARDGHAMAAQGVNVVLFGGRDGVGTRNDTWEWDGTNWAQRTPSSAPPAVSFHSMAKLGSRVLLFGGFGDPGSMSGTWEWDGTTWSSRTSGMTPPARSSSALATLGTRLVLLGGSSDTARINDCFTWDGTNWSASSAPTNVAPSPRTELAAAALGTTKLVLFGGLAGTTRLDDTWEWDGAKWAQRTPMARPIARSRHAMASLGSKVVLFGGLGGTLIYADTWEWDGTNWAQKTPATAPPAREGHAMATAGMKIVLFGGLGTSGRLADTWEWDGTNWAQKTPATSPSARDAHVMATLGSTAVLFGGYDNANPLNDTWEWSGSTWTQRLPTHVPPARVDSGLGTVGGKLVLFGGASLLGAILGDTWEWNGTDWTQRPGLAPLARRKHAMATLGAKVVVFGGTGAIGTLDDTWHRRDTRGLAAPCGNAAECESGFCVDGVCCNTLCAEPCAACDLAGRAGTCSAVGSTIECRAAAGPCDRAELCDGTSLLCPADVLVSGGTQCRAASCTAAVATLRGNCSGIATTCPNVQTQACAPYSCGATACAGNCTLDTDCAAGRWCSAGVCVLQLSAGTVCGAGPQCASGFCVDGVCCNTACTGQCAACDVAGSLGTCGAATGAPRPGRMACVSDGSACGGRCNGVTTTACTYPATTVGCRSASCAAGTGTLPENCDGQGRCPALQTQGCAPYTCGVTSCRGSCSTIADCTAGNWCNAGACVPLRSPGEGCAAAGECRSGFCVDGVCCDRACDGQCEACTVPDAFGLCLPITGAPYGLRAACSGRGACQGTCDGVTASACTLPGPSKVCSPAACAGDSVAAASKCDGQGTCPVAATTSCGDFTCRAAACTTNCAADSECATGHFCAKGLCTATKPTGCGCTEGSDGLPLVALLGLLARRLSKSAGRRGALRRGQG